MAVRKKGHDRWLSEVKRSWVQVCSCLFSTQDRLGVSQLHHQFATVVGELEDLLVDAVAATLDDPDMTLRIIGVDVDLVWSVKDRIPLRPVLNDVAVAIDDDQVIRAAWSILSLVVLITPDGYDNSIWRVRCNT